MTQIPLLEELAIIAALGVIVTVLLSRLRLPAVAGLLAAGALLGPFGLRLVEDVHSIEELAEVGVILLLFTIGLEFSVGRLRNIFRTVAIGGAVQVAATVGATAAVGLFFGLSPAQATFYGFVVALSSTAIVLRALSHRGELDSPHGRFIVGTLIFQDLCVVPMVLLVPVLASGGTFSVVALEVATATAQAVAVVVGILLVSRLIVPRVLHWVAVSRSRDVFLLAVLAICVGTAWLTSLAGLSLALGAFLGGIVVADTEFQHRALGDMIPLRDAFVSVFFVSLGMLFDGSLLLQRPVAVLLLFLAFVVAKAALAGLAAVLMRFPPRAAWLAGIGLAQFGEFGFVLLKQGESVGLASGPAVSLVLSAGILSMFVTPILTRMAPHITAGERLLAPLTRILGVRGAEQIAEDHGFDHHIVVIGYGVAGRLIGRSLAASGVPFCALELNVDTVRSAQSAGEPVYYADATSEEALAHAHIASARAAVVLINDPLAARRVVDTLRRVVPELPVMIRTRYLSDRAELKALGASDVVAEEVEASVEMLSRVLRRLEVPRNEINQHVADARTMLQTSDRKITVPRAVLPEHAALADLKIENVRLSEASHAAGRSIVELDLRRQSGALVVAIRRGSELLEQPRPAEPFEVGDVVYLVGSNRAIRAAMALLEEGASRSGAVDDTLPPR